MKVFLSPSDQDNNPVVGGGNEQQFARIRCDAMARVLRAHGVEVVVSQRGTGDDSNGYAASVAEGNAIKGLDLYWADHTNATGSPKVVRSGVEMYVWPGDPLARKVAEAVAQRLQPFFPHAPKWQIRDGSHLYEVNGPYCTAILSEAGFHDHPEDAEVIRTKSVQLGEAQAYGVLAAFGIASIKPLGAGATAALNPKENSMNLQAIADAVRDLMIIERKTDEGVHKSSFGLNVVDLVQRVIGIFDGDFPKIRRKLADGTIHEVGLAASQGNVEDRVVKIDDRTQRIEKALAELAAKIGGGSDE